MIYRLFFLFSIYCYSQTDNFNYLSLNNNINTHYSFEINNLGDPLVYLTHFYSEEFTICHVLNNSRHVNKFNVPQYTEGVYSSLYYEGAFNEGGFLKTIFSRPIGRNTNLIFSYDNLSSQGFYSYQKNKYSRLYLAVDMLNGEKPYSLFFSFFSINSDYQQNGGIVNYDSSISTDLMETKLSTANTFIKQREIKISHQYNFDIFNILKHEFSISSFNRNYLDPSSLTLQGDTLKNFFNYFENTISASIKYLTFALNHMSYKTDNIVNTGNPINDFFIVLRNSDYKIFKRNFKFKLSYCPVGYRKKNYQFFINFTKKNINHQHDIRLDHYDKKPNFYTVNSFDSLYPNWINFNSINFTSIKFNTIWFPRNIVTGVKISRYVNYTFFDEMMYPNQFENPLFYIDFRLEKKWKFKHISIQSSLVAQYSDNKVISYPNILTHQYIKYNFDILDGVDLISSLNLYIFSRYYNHLYSPDLDLFYLQFSKRNKFNPHVNADFFLQKNNFQIGILCDYISTIFSKKQYFVDSYILPNPIFRLSIKWSFLD